MAENNELPLDANQFDAIMMGLAFHDTYWINPEGGWPEIDRPALNAELFASLKPGGLLGIVDHYAAAGASSDTGSTVHRIDRETSGCLVMAKRRSALRELHERFRQGEVEKNYMALVVGNWQLGEQLIDAPLYVQNRQNGERHVVVSGKLGKEAQTRVSLSRKYGKYSLLQCAPLTGRTHQIRVHLDHAEHPIIGDQRYGDDDANRKAKKFGLKRLFLHAQSIAFPDKSGNDLHFTAPLAEDLERFLSSGIAESRKRS